jgi:hypothetical protein
MALAYDLTHARPAEDPKAGDVSEEQKIAGNEVAVEIRKITECITMKREPYPKVPDEMWTEVGELIIRVLNDGRRPDLGIGAYDNRISGDARGLWNKIQGQRRYAWEENNVANFYPVLIQSGKTFSCGSFYIEADEVHTDADGKLHCEKGPSIRIGSMKMYHLEGVRVSAKIIEFPEHLQVADVERESNAEIRRIIIKQMGHERYLLNSGAKVLHMDAHKFNGTRCLYGAKHGKFMQCVCPSTGRVYWLDVPPEIETCEKADEFLVSGVWQKGRQVGRT